MKHGGSFWLAGAMALSALIVLGIAPVALAQDPPVASDKELTPYQKALLNYKSGKYEEAKAAIDQTPPGDVATEVLRAKILNELGDFAGAQKALKPLLGPTAPLTVLLAMGDVLLHKRNFSGAAPYYEAALTAKPEDPDISLKLIYAKVGASDLATAEKYASHLRPFDPSVDPLDPKHPGNPAYYFAKAAIAQATGKTEVADEDIQNVRTLYGIAVTNRYLKTYLEVVTEPAKSAPKATGPGGATNAAPSGR